MSEPKTTWRVEHWYDVRQCWMPVGYPLETLEHAREHADGLNELFGNRRIIRIETREFVEEER